jgi:hypothetical protein
VLVLAGGSVSGRFEGSALSLEPVMKAMFALAPA